MFEKVKAFGKNAVQSVKNKVMDVESALAVKGHALLDGTEAEAYVDSGIKILIAVVVGALLLGGLVWLFNEVIFPKVSDEVSEVFDVEAQAFTPPA